MKRILLLGLSALILMTLAACTRETDVEVIQPEFRVNGGLLEYRSGDMPWISLIDTTDFEGSDGRDGVNGQDGVDGVSIADASINDEGNLLLTLSNGNVLNAGTVVSVGPGRDAPDEAPGFVLEETYVNDDGELIIVAVDGTELNAGNVVGPEGPRGATGSSGSAGEDGEDGAPGAPGPAGSPGTDGDDGDQGPQGDPGEDAEVITTASDASEFQTLSEYASVDTILFTQDITFEDSLTTDLVLTFDELKAKGNLSFVTDGAINITITGSGMLDGSLEVDLANGNFSLGPDLEVTGTTTISAIDTASFETSAIHGGPIVFMGTGRLLTTTNAINTSVIVNTTEAVILDGQQAQIDIQKDEAHVTVQSIVNELMINGSGSSVQVDGTVTDLMVNENTSLFIGNEASIETTSVDREKTVEVTGGNTSVPVILSELSFNANGDEISFKASKTPTALTWNDEDVFASLTSASGVFTVTVDVNQTNNQLQVSANGLKDNAYDLTPNVWNETQELGHDLIQDGIDAAISGSTIHVQPGEYNEYLNIYGLDNLEILGPNHDSTEYNREKEAKIYYDLSEHPWKFPKLLYSSVYNLTLSGFTFSLDNDDISWDSMIRIDGAQTTFSNNYILNKNDMVSLLLYNGISGASIHNNTFEGYSQTYSTLYLQNYGGVVEYNQFTGAAVESLQVQPYSNEFGGIVRYNEIYSTRTNIYHNVAKKGSAEWVYHNNTLSGINPSKSTEESWRGLYIGNYGTSGEGTEPNVVFKDNFIDASLSEATTKVGVYFINTHEDATYVISGNTFQNIDVGASIVEVGNAPNGFSGSLLQLLQDNSFPDGFVVEDDLIRASQNELAE